MSIALGVLLILVLTAATGFFVAMEFAYVAVDRNALGRLAATGDAAAERAVRVTARLSFTLSAAQLGITVTALLVGYVSEPLVGVGLAELLDPSLSYAARLSISVALVLAFSTVVQMVFGELAPKNLAIARTVPLARALSRSTLVYLAVSGPVVRLFDTASTRLLRRVGIEPVEELEQGATADDLSRIIDESHDRGLLGDDLSDALAGGLRLRDLDAGDVMTPRVRVTTVRADEPVSRLLEMLDTGWSRFPVTGADGDDIVGVAGIADLLAVEPHRRASTPIGSVTPAPTVVPTSAPLPRVLDQLRADHRQLAVVVDEHGGFAGVVSFEDIAEEVVGEIFDEDDHHEAPTVLAEGSGWMVLGHLRLDELAATTGLLLDGPDEHSTISGLVLERLGRVARVGDVIDAPAAAEGEPARLATDTDNAENPENPGNTESSDAGGPAGAVDGPSTGIGSPATRPVNVRLHVTRIERHVPAQVRVEVHELDDFDDSDDSEAHDQRDANGEGGDR